MDEERDVLTETEEKQNTTAEEKKAASKQEAPQQTPEMTKADDVEKQQERKKEKLDKIDNIGPKKESILKRFWEKFKKVMLFVPRKVVDNIAYMMLPKDAKVKLFEKAFEEQKYQKQQKQQEKVRETERTRYRKREIVQDKNLNNLEKIERLCYLCKETGETLYAMTPNGALRFTKDGNDIFIAYADKMRPTEESMDTYAFKTVAHANAGYDKKEGWHIVTEKSNLIDAVTYVNNQNGFHDSMTDMPYDAVIENGEPYGTDTKKDTVQITDEQMLAQAIITGDEKTIDNLISKMLTNEEQENKKEELNKLKELVGNKDYIAAAFAYHELQTPKEPDKDIEKTDISKETQEKDIPETDIDADKLTEAVLSGNITEVDRCLTVLMPEMQQQEYQAKDQTEIHTLFENGDLEQAFTKICGLLTAGSEYVQMEEPENVDIAIETEHDMNNTEQAFFGDEDIVYSDPECDAFASFGDILQQDMEQHPELYQDFTQDELEF